MIADAVASGCVDALVTVAKPDDVLFVAPKSDQANVTNGTDYRPTLTAAWPVCSASGWVLLGELDKYVPLSSQRFEATACTPTGVSATVCGAAGEGEIELTALKPSGGDKPRQVVTTTVSIPAAGGCVDVAFPTSRAEASVEAEVEATAAFCTSDFECSFNGECVDGARCACGVGWTGDAACSACGTASRRVTLAASAMVER